MAQITRRSGFGAILGALAVPVSIGALTGPAWSAPQVLAPPDAPIRLFPNLFTRVAARVRINAQGPFLFVIDTGASRTCVSDLVVEALGLSLSSEVVVHGVTQASLTPSVLLDQLTIDGLAFPGLRAPVLPFGQVGAHGLLGLDILANFALGFDVISSTVTMTKASDGFSLSATSTASRGQRPNEVRSRRGAFGQLIISEAVVEGQRVSAFIDSGAQYSIANRAMLNLIAAQAPEGLQKRREVPILGVTGQSLPGEVAEVSSIRLGRSNLGATTLLFADLHCFTTLGLAELPTRLIGADLLSRFRRFAIDFARNEVVFEGLRRPNGHATGARVFGTG